MGCGPWLRVDLIMYSLYVHYVVWLLIGLDWIGLDWIGIGLD